MYCGTEGLPSYPDAYYRLNKEITSCVKMYLGYAPYYSNHEYCHNEVYAAYLQKKYGKDINGLMGQVGIKDFGPVKKPINNGVGPQADLIQALKRIYQVEGLYFYDYSYGYRYRCSTKHLDKMHIDSGSLKKLMEVLSGTRIGPATIIFDDTSTEHKTLDSLRTEMFIIKLAGI